MVANAWLGPAAVRRFEQDADRLVELLARGFDVSELEVVLAGAEVSIRGFDQRQNRIGRRYLWQNGSLLGDGDDRWAGDGRNRLRGRRGVADARPATGGGDREQQHTKRPFV